MRSAVDSPKPQGKLKDSMTAIRTREGMVSKQTSSHVVEHTFNRCASDRDAFTMSTSRNVFFLIFAVVLRGYAHGATLVDNFSSVSQAFTIGSSERGAQAFLTGQDTYIITEAAIIGYMQSTSQQIELKIYSDYNGKPDVAVVTLFSGTTGQAGFNKNFIGRMPSVFSNLEVELLPDTRYWLVLENRSGVDIWSGYTKATGSTQIYGPGYIEKSKLSQGLKGSDWLNNTHDYGCRIYAVPEPNTATFLMLSFGVLFGRRRRGTLSHDKE